MPALTGGPVPGGGAEPAALRRFVRASTKLAAAGLVPEIRLHLAGDPWRLWDESERAFEGHDPHPPFWAFAWAGGQALARYVLDHPDVVQGRRVHDLATGSGLVAIAAALSGAAAVTASDIDPVAVAAVELNARANGVTVAACRADVLGDAGDAATSAGDGRVGGSETVLVADAFYEKDLAGRVLRALGSAAKRSAAVLVADVGRRYLPRGQFRELAAYQVPVLHTLEDADVKRAAVLEPAW